MTAEREHDRDRLRADRLTREADRYRAARENLEVLHDRGARKPATIAMRQRLILTPNLRQSPAMKLRGRNGTALGFYLVALFEAQTRRPASRAAVANQRDMDANGDRPGWKDLVPHAARKEATSRQVQRALTRLEDARLVALGADGSRGRYDRFKLLRESGSTARNGYTVPPKKVEVFRIPTPFFVNGWVHALTAAEIILLMVLLDLHQRLGPGDVYLADSRKIDYSLTPDVYERHSALAAYGLIERLTDPDRRAGGTFIRRPDTGEATHPWRFRIHPDQLKQGAHSTVVTALRMNASSAGSPAQH